MKKRNRSAKIGYNSLCFGVAFFLICASVFSVSCKMTAEGVVAVSDDVGNPVLSDFFQDSEKGLFLHFTEKVSLSNLEVRSGTPGSMGDVVFSEGQLRFEESVVSGNGKAPGAGTEGEGGVELETIQIQVIFDNARQLEAGAAYVLSGVAHDDEGNSLHFQIPFHGFNSNVAGVVLSEVRTEASDAKKNNAKIEFVELYVHSPGDLAGVSLTSIYDEKKFGEYVFPSVEVSAGEYIVVHFRTMEEHKVGCIDETSSDLNASTAPDSCADARDFWVPGTDARLGKSDVIVVRERQNGKIMDALLYAESGIKESTLEKLLSSAQQVIAEGGWSGTEDVSTWVSADDLTATRTLTRQNIDEIGAAESGSSIPVASNEHWFVVGTSSATPGLPNSTNKYTPK